MALLRSNFTLRKWVKLWKFLPESFLRRFSCHGIHQFYKRKQNFSFLIRKAFMSGVSGEWEWKRKEKCVLSWSDRENCQLVEFTVHGDILLSSSDSIFDLSQTRFHYYLSPWRIGKNKRRWRWKKDIKSIITLFCYL